MTSPAITIDGPMAWDGANMFMIGAPGFMRIDPVNAIAVVLGTVTFPAGHERGGMTYDRVNDILYFATHDGNGISLHKINKATGAIISTVAVTGPTHFGNTAIEASASGGLLYLVVSSRFYNVNPTTGIATLVGPTGAISVVSMTDFGGVLYGASPDGLRTVNPATGAATVLGPFVIAAGSTPTRGSIFIGRNATGLYLSSRGNDIFYSIDIATRTLTEIATATIAATLAPNVPTGLALVPDQNNLKISWTPPVASPTFGAAATYDVRYRVANTVDWTTQIGSTGAAATAISGLLSDTLYEVQVRAVNVGGESAYTDSVQARTGIVAFGVAYRVRAFMHGAWVDLSDRMFEMDWGLGGPQTNGFGSIYPDSRASILLRNDDGDLTPYAPAAYFNPVMGPPLEIATRPDSVSPWTTQFAGFSNGFNDRVNAIGNFVHVIGLGPLTWIERFHDEVFIRLYGNHLSGALINSLLDDVGWSTTRRDIADGDITIRAHEAVKAGAFYQGRRLSSFAASTKMVALAENGRVRPSRIGQVVYENYNLRPELGALIGPIALNIDPSQAYITNGQGAGFADSEGIVNIIRSNNEQYAEVGSNVAVKVEGGLPKTLVIPPGSTGYGLMFRADVTQSGVTGQAFVQNWTAPVYGTTYTYTLPEANVTIDAGEGFIRFLCVNSSAVDQTLTVTSLFGNVFNRTSAIAIDPRRNDSVDLFGPSDREYPGSIVADLGQARANIEQLLDLHDGIEYDGSGNVVVAPIRRLTVVTRIDNDPRNHIYLKRGEISELVSVRAPHLGINIATRFFLDGAHHVVDHRRVHTMTINLFAANAFAIKPTP